jgi:hypothetical protein
MNHRDTETQRTACSDYFREVPEIIRNYSPCLCVSSERSERVVKEVVSGW